MLTADSALVKLIDDGFEIAKLQAATEGSFDERMLRHFYAAAWELCADMIGGFSPAKEMRENVCPSPIDGVIRLSAQPSGPVRFYSGVQLVATVPPNSVVLGGNAGCMVPLCCYCNLVAYYPTGRDLCDVPARFKQAVARVFTYMVENRGDVEMDEAVLCKCGAIAFLRPDLTYVA